MGYTHGNQWSYKKICNEIYKVMNILNITSMPSANECNMITGNSGLSNVIAKRDGFYYFANNLGLEIKKKSNSNRQRI